MNLRNEMEALGVKPTEVTYFSLLWGCVHRRDYYDQAFDLLEQMRLLGFAPQREHLVQLLGVCAKGGDQGTAEL